MADTDKSLYNLRYNQITSNLEAFGGGSPQWTLITLNNVDPQQVPVTRQINTAAPLQGGGNLTVDRTLSILQSSNISDGYLSSVDWNTFNNKQPAGSYITALTGDATATGPGSVPLTLATVNGNVGTFSYASITVNAKGLITSASNGATGSLTDVGTDGIVITNGTGAVIGSGTSIAQHVADATHNGYLSSTDWNTFNNKESAVLTNTHIFVGNASNVPTDVALSGDAALANTGALTLATVNSNVGSFTTASITVDAKGRITAASSGTSAITQLTGDVTAGPGGGSQAATLATVNGNVGSFTNASITVNAKGLITAASNGTAPVTSVSGTANQISSTGGTTPVLSLSSTLQLPGTLQLGGDENANSHKITNLTNGSAAQDAMAFGQFFGPFQAQVQVTDHTNVTSTSSTFANTSLAATITPTSSSHKVRITVTGTGAADAANTILRVTIARGSTNLGGTHGFVLVSSSATSINAPVAISYIDSPATTSATTYTVQIASSSASTVEWSPDGSANSVIILEEIL